MSSSRLVAADCAAIWPSRRLGVDAHERDRPSPSASRSPAHSVCVWIASSFVHVSSSSAAMPQRCAACQAELPESCKFCTQCQYTVDTMHTGTIDVALASFSVCSFVSLQAEART